MVTVELAEDPGATEEGDRLDDTILKSGAVTTTTTAGEVLAT
jgi:hypothetical protein